MRVIVCGSRSWRDARMIEAVLGQLAADCMPRGESLTVIEGGQVSVDSKTGMRHGADHFAGAWAKRTTDIGWMQCPAAWETCVPDCPPDRSHRRVRRDGTKYCPTAGHRRNQHMLEVGKPGLVLAFVDKPLSRSRGTADMVRRARKAGVPVEVRNSQDRTVYRLDSLETS